MSDGYFQFFAGDYLKKTGHLSLTEHGAYLKLLAHYYSTGKPLPNELPRLMRIAQSQGGIEDKAVEHVITEFFPLGEDGFRHNKRADEEIKRRTDFIAEQTRKSALGVSARLTRGSTRRKTRGSTRRTTLSSPSPSLPPTATPPTDVSSPSDSLVPVGTPPDGTKPRPVMPTYTQDFLAFWAAYPKHEDKRDAWKAWQSLDGKRPPLDELLSAIERQRSGRKWQDGFIKQPASWLRKGSWEDEPELPAAPPQPKITKPLTEDERAEIRKWA